MSARECDGCGLAACDLPDGVDPDLIFESDGKRTLCQGCAGDDREDDPETCPNGSTTCGGGYLCSDCDDDRHEVDLLQQDEADRGR